MPIIRKERTPGTFFQMAIDAPTDKNLSWGAKGLLTFLLTLPDNWEIRHEHLKDCSTDGIFATRALLEELVDNGYISRDSTSHYDPILKRYSPYDYTIYEERQSFDHQSLLSNDRKPIFGNQSITITNQRSTCSDEHSQGKPSIGSQNSTGLFVPSDLPPKMNLEIYDLLQHVLPTNFNHRLPAPGESPTKLIQNCEKMLLSIYGHRFDKEYSFDESWTKATKIVWNRLYDQCTTMSDLTKLVRRALAVLHKMRQPEHWPPNKNTLPKTFEEFLYNPVTQKSWFLSCLFRGVETPKGSVTSKTIETLADKDRLPAEAFLKKHPTWDKFLYWGKIKRLLAWMEENKVRLQRDFPSYPAAAGNLRLMLERIEEFAETWEGFAVHNFGPDNGSWRIFSDWLDKKYGIRLEPRTKIDSK